MNHFTLDDFRKQLSQIGKLGLPQKLRTQLKDMVGDVDLENDMKCLLGIIDSMTPAERRNPSKSIDQSRRRRIAAGAGVQPNEVSDLVNHFDAIAKIVTSMAGR